MPILDNHKHELFAQELAKGLSASAAYVKAGFTKNDGNASRLKSNEKVRVRFDELMAKAAEDAGLTVQWVLDGIKENFERAMQHVEVKNSQGLGTGEFKYDGAVANKALELAGKHLGMFKEQVEHDHRGTIGFQRIERVIVDSPANSNAEGLPTITRTRAV